jgi:glycosyltransferase involved in cell wall biosynthesis
MPTYNKGGRLAITLKSFCYQKTSRQFEIILVDGGESPNCEANRFSTYLPLKIIRVENLGRSHNRNSGINVAEGELLIFCDDDLIVEPLFIEAHCLAHDTKSNLLVHGWKNEIPYVRFFMDPREPRKGLINGCQNRMISNELLNYQIVEEEFPNNLDKIKKWGHSQDYLEKNIRYMFANGISKYSISFLASCTANMSLPRSLAFEVGLFQESFGLEWGPEDLEFGYRIYKSGGVFGDAPQAQNYHIAHARSNWRSIAQQGFQKFQALYPEEPLITHVAELLIEKIGNINSFLIATG